MPDTPFLALKPIPMKERVSLMFLKRCQIDVKDDSFVAIREDEVRTHVPVGSVACIMLEHADFTA